MPGTLIDRAKLEPAYKGFEILFQDALANTPVITETLATVINSTSTEEQYKWMGALPKMKEWLGDRSLAKLRAYDWTIKNKQWANAIEVDVNDIKDDKLGLVAPRIRMLAEMAARHEEELLFSLLTKGFTDLCYDGQFFFDTDHKDGDGPTQSNKGTAVFAAAAYENAFRDLMLIKDENSEPMSIMPTHLIVGPSNRALARTVLLAERNGNGSTNTNFGTVELIVHPRLTGADANKWFLLALGGHVKSLILQRREPVQFRAQDSAEDEHAFMRNVFRYGSDARYNAGYGLWQFAWGSDGTV